MTRDSSTDPSSDVRSHLSRAGVLIVLGLLVEASTLFSAHPTAFLVFAGAGAGLVVLGIAVYFWAVLRAQPVPVDR
ncbi:MAG: hypothetical protein MPN21_16310 [Thermoanaerobaculia bacterium]|nr:hypothetical protein [Thermoanaerobaculia bacterium]